LFLSINGHRLTAGQVDAIAVMVGVASGIIDETASTAWLAANIAAR
jgi:prophage maintenance system killer protein